ncbi:MAG: cation diffusion facilitator family transporter [Burkholderiaceae bacterium]
MSGTSPDSAGSSPPAPAAARASGSSAARLAWGTAVIGVLVFALKWGAWRVSGSVALYSDALESIVNIVAAVGAAIAIRVGALPADANHPFGHSKAEYLSASFEGALIIVAAFSILGEAWHGLVQPRAYGDIGLGMAVNIVASVLNAGWAFVLMRAGSRLRSPALVADARHLFTDVWTSVGVVIGIVLVRLTGWWVLDPLLAAAVAVNILWVGWKLVRSSADALMDAAPPPEVLDTIGRVLDESSHGAIEYHDVRVRIAGHTTFIQLHLVVDAGMRVGDAHAICDRIEAALREAIDGARVTIHVEPPDKAKRHRAGTGGSAFVGSPR